MLVIKRSRDEAYRPRHYQPKGKIEKKEKENPRTNQFPLNIFKEKEKILVIFSLDLKKDPTNMLLGALGKGG